MKTCSRCGHLNNDAADICLNCRAQLNSIDVNTPYKNYQNDKVSMEEKENDQKKWNFWWFIIDTVITLIIVIIACSNR